MNNALAAILGGFGQGATSYGKSRIDEQNQERLAQQRMAELRQQEAARIAQTREAAALRQQQIQEDGDQAAIIARSLGLELPPGARINSQGVQILAQDAAGKRQAAGNAAAMERAQLGTNAAMERLQAQMAGQSDMLRTRLDATRDLTQAQIENLRSQVNQRGGSGDQPPADTRRPMPSSVGKEIGEVGDVYAMIRDASESMKTPEAKNATGLRYGITKALLPSSLETKASSMWDGGKGDVVRARLGNLWSTIGKLRSGGAITDSEFQRLQPFLPSDGDSYDKNVTKLTELERAYKDVLDRKLAIYGQTYQVPALDAITGQRGAAAQPPAKPPTGYSPSNPFTRRTP